MPSMCPTADPGDFLFHGENDTHYIPAYYATFEDIGTFNTANLMEFLCTPSSLASHMEDVGTGSNDGKII